MFGRLACNNHCVSFWANFYKLHDMRNLTLDPRLRTKAHKHFKDHKPLSLTISAWKTDSLPFPIIRDSKSLQLIVHHSSLDLDVYNSEWFLKVALIVTFKFQVARERRGLDEHTPSFLRTYLVRIIQHFHFHIPRQMWPCLAARENGYYDLWVCSNVLN